jgi:septal ring factor EnvC (AmiA/AmiB activator)
MVQSRDTARTSRDLKRIVLALQRQSQRVPKLERELSAGREMTATLNARSRDLQRELSSTSKLIREMERALSAIVAIEHGKRVDRRLARAQRLAERALTQVSRSRNDDEPAVAARAPAPRRAVRTAQG